MALYNFGKLNCLFGVDKKKSSVQTNDTCYNPDRRSVRSTASSDDEANLRPSDIQAFSASSTLHGFSHMFALHHSLLRRMFWGLAFFASILFFVLQCTNRTAYYLGYPHVTKLDEVTAGDLKFPAVTICNVNEFRFSQVTRKDMFYVGTLLGILDDRNNLIRPRFYSDVERMDDGPTKRRLMEVKNRVDDLTNFKYPQIRSDRRFDMYEFYNRTGHDLSKFLLGCKYRGERCNHTWFTQKENDEKKEEKPSDFAFFASNSTLHGISHIFTPGRFTFRKALWFAAFAASAGFFTYQGCDRYAYYRSRPHVTKLDEKEAANLTFPAVTICNMNPFRLKAVTTDDFYYIGHHLLKIFDKNNQLLNNVHKDSRTWPGVQEKITPIVGTRSYNPNSDTFDMFEFYDRAGHLLNGMLKSCKIDGDLCKDNHWSPIYTRYGKCYTFNSGKTFSPLKTLKGGVDNGLELLLDAEQDDYMPVWAETDEISVEAGFKVQIHVQDEPPFIHELGFGISPGFQTLVATQEQRITFLPEPYGVCESGKNKSKHFHFDKYSISACRITCETEFVLKKCGCIMIHMPGNASYCPPETYKKCADDKLDYLVQSDEKICVCGTPCDVTRYNLEMSSLQLPSTQALSYMAYKYRKTEDYVKNNFVKLNIFFEALNYETIDQKKAYEIPGLFGDIGGQMGLFIGASLLTLLELFDYLYEVFKYKFFRKKRKNKQASRDLTSEMDNKEMEVIQSPNLLQDNHVTNLSPYTPQSHLPPPQNFSSGIPKQILPPKPLCTPASYNKEYYTTPMPHYLGNSAMTLRGDRFQDKEAEAMASQHVNLPPQMLLQKGRKSSLSYDDLYRAPNCNPSNEHQRHNATTPNFSIEHQRHNDTTPNFSIEHQRHNDTTSNFLNEQQLQNAPPPNFLNYNSVGPSQIGCLASTTNAVASRSYFRNRGNYATVNGKQHSSAPLSNSQIFPIATQDFPASIETDIH